MNILPTTPDPLSGLETYTGRSSGIFPQAKHAARSIASAKHEPTKFNFTTGTCTKRNYIQKAAGLKAEQHHTYGAVLVEVDSDGTWFVRQLQQDSRGRMCDLDVAVQKGRAYKRQRVESVMWGDIHAEKCDPTVRRLAWGKRGILDTLRPKRQYVHDLIDFAPRNHHNIKNPHFRFERFVDGQETVEEEMHTAVELLHEMERDWCETVVVNSNHDNAALTKWLREADYREDPANALFFLKCQLATYEAIARKDRKFILLEHVLRERNCPKRVKFLGIDESSITCEGVDGGIENGNHGHLGVGGSRGSPRALSKVGRRQNTAHTHASGIFDGLFSGGTSSLLDMGYNQGPGNWSHTLVITYPGGKRSLSTIYNEKWRAAG